MGTSKQKKTPAEQKTAPDTKALQKHIWSALSSVADDAGAKLVSAQRSGKISASEKDIQLIISVIRATAESAASGVTKSIIAAIR